MNPTPPNPTPHLRIARPVSDLARSVRQYIQGLGLQEIGRFQDHAGFDGVMLAFPGAAWHLEFTHCVIHVVQPTSSVEDLLVFYHPERAQWQASCERLRAAGFVSIASFNPYWDERGASFADDDGYRVVLQNAAWQSIVPST